MSVNTAHWLVAIDAHPETIDTDLVVATALANGDADVEGLDPERPEVSQGIETHPLLDGLSPDDVTDAVEMLIGYGFLEDVVAVDRGDGTEEHVLELRLPE